MEPASKGTDVYFSHRAHLSRILITGGNLFELINTSNLPDTEKQDDIGHIYIDEVYLYTTTTDNYSLILKIPASVGTPTVLADNQVEPRCIVADTTHVYWNEISLNDPTGVIIVEGTIKKGPIDDGAAETLISGLTSPIYIAIDTTHVYFTCYGDREVENSGSLWRVPIEGGEATELVVDLYCPGTIAVDDEYVYWADDCSDKIMKIRK